MQTFARAAMIAAMFVATSAIAQQTADESADQETQQKVSNRPLRGTIIGTNIEAKTLTVQVKKGSELADIVVETGAATQITIDQTQATFVDLRKGMKVVVLPDVGMATKVTATRVKQPPKRTEGKKPASQG